MILYDLVWSYWVMDTRIKYSSNWILVTVTHPSKTCLCFTPSTIHEFLFIYFTFARNLTLKADDITLPLNIHFVLKPYELKPFSMKDVRNNYVLFKWGVISLPTSLCPRMIHVIYVLPVAVIPLQNNPSLSTFVFVFLFCLFNSKDVLSLWLSCTMHP